MRKIFSLLIALGVLLSVWTSVSAEDVRAGKTGSDALNRCVSLGIIQGYEDGSFGEGQPLTRAEFSSVLVRLLNMENILSGIEASPYTDVPADHWAASAINLVTQMNYMQGVGGHLFEPESPVTYSQAVKVLVLLLGYDAAVENHGGDPYTPYWNTAAKIGLTRYLPLAGDVPMPRGDLIILLDNALDIPVMVKIGEGEYQIAKDSTLLDNFRRDGEELTGIVEATNEISLREEIDLNEDQVVIDGYIYQVGDTNARDLLGMQVSFYMKTVDGKACIQGIYPIAGKNNLLTVSGGDIVSAGQDTVTYLDENGAERRISITNTRIACNSSLYSGSKQELFRSPNAKFRFLDNDGDQKYDWVFAQVYELAQVLKVNPTDEAVYLQTTLKSGSRSITYGEPGKNISFFTRDGEELDPVDLDQEDLWLEIYAGQDGRTTKVYALQDSLTGQVENLYADRGEVTIDGTVYELACDAAGMIVPVETLKPGEIYDFTLDTDGRIVFAEDSDETGTEHYGYIFGIASSGVFASELQLKLITGTKVVNFEENKKYYIQGKDRQEMVICPVADRVRIDDVIYKDLSKAADKLRAIYQPSPDPDLARGNVIRYTLNGNDEINRIEILDPYGQYVSRKLNAEQMVLGGDDTPFGLDGSTVVFFVPKSGEDEDIGCEMKFTAGSYNTMGFDLDEDTSTVSAAIFQSPLSVYDDSDFGADEKTKIIQAVSRELNAEGDTVYRISGYAGQEIFNTTVRSGISLIDQVAANLVQGDVVQFSTDFDGQINRIKKIVSLPSDTEYYHQGAQTSHETIYGIAAEADKNYLGVGATAYQNRLSMSLDREGTDTASFQMPVKATEAPDIYVYYEKNKLVTAGDFDDILTMNQVGADDASRIILYASNSVVKTIVVLK